MKKKIVSILLVICMLCIYFGANLSTLSADEDEEIFDYAIETLSSDDDSLSIVSPSGCLNGNLCSEGRITAKNMNLNGSVFEEQNKKIPILFDALYRDYFSCARVYEDTTGMDCNINSAVVFKNTADLLSTESSTPSTINLNGPIQARGDINIKCQTLNANNTVIISESGNINIKCNNVSITGMIYLPYGTLNIEADNINLNNVCIIANKVKLNAKYNLNINASQQLKEYVNSNARYDDSRYFIYANGSIDGTVLNISWNTNLDADKFNIYESDNNSDYSKIATVENVAEFSMELTDDFTEKFYYVEAEDYKSISFKLVKNNDGIYVEEPDSDGDLIPDAIELIFGTNVYNSDSDGDGLTDYDEVMTVDTNPLNTDSNKNGINDYLDDVDADGLNNGYEVLIGTNPLYSDTDMDDLTDYDEVTLYGTNPLQKDTDADRASDSYEINNGTDPLTADKGFSASATSGEVSETDPVGASVYIENADIDPESLNIERVMTHDNYNITPLIAGYLGDAFDFSVDGTFTEAKLVYTYDKSLGEISDTFQPRIYYFNEETEMFEELENQVVEDGKVTAYTTHFSTNILLNKVEFDEVWNYEIKAPAEENSLNVAFVMDVSGSMSGSKIRNAKSAMNTFVDELGENDSSAIITFSSDARVRCGFTSNKETVKKSVNSLTATGGTAIYSGIKTALEEFKKTDPNGYRIMIVFTDGYDEPSTTYNGYYKSLVDEAVENNITIYTIGISTNNEDILEKIAETTGGKYYYATFISQLGKKLQEIKEETDDLTLDSNGDGITDYYTELIKEGKIVLRNGSEEFKGVDFSVNYEGEPSADWDGDGLKNGDEIFIDDISGKTCIYMKSNPLLVYTDGDTLDDFTEVKTGSNPKELSVSKEAVDYLTDDSWYVYEDYVNDYKNGNFNKFMVGYSSVITGAWNHYEIYRDLLIDYYSTYVTQDVIDATELIETKKVLTDVLEQLLSKVGTNYGIAYYIHILLSGVNGAKNADELNKLYNVKVSKFFSAFSTLLKNKVNVNISVNTKLISKYLSEVGTAETLSKISNIFVVAVSLADIEDTITSISNINANQAVFEENMDALSWLIDSEFINMTMSNAANDVMNSIGKQYANIIEVSVFLDAIEMTDNVLSNILLLKIPYINVILSIRNLCKIFTGAKDDIIQMYKMIGYSDMINAYSGLLNINVEQSFNGKYYEVLFERDNDCLRYLSNISQLRILGEKEQYYFYKSDGMFKKIVNSLNESDTVKKNTNDKINWIRTQINELNIILSNQMKYEV